jgi:hypothetical protein
MVKISSILKTALALIPLILVVFACSFLPSNIEILGTPELSFNANKSLTDMFKDMIGKPESDVDVNTEILPCKNVEYQTYIVYAQLYDGDFNVDLSTPGEINGQSYTPVSGGKIKINDDVEILQNKIKSISFGKGLNNYFENFEFSEVNSTIFISGSDVINSIMLEIEGLPAPAGADPDYHSGTYKVYPTNTSSGYESWNGEYTGKTMPEGCKTFNISSCVMSGETLDINFRAFLKKDEEIDPDWLNLPITVEFIIWYPLVFEATKDDAKINFPDDFFGDGESDLFGRTEPNQDDKMSPTEIIQSMELTIKLNHDLFDGAKLNINSKDITISTDELKGQYLGFKIDEENMKKINEPDNFPFNPKFSFNFKKGGRFNVPWELNTEEFSLKARLHHTISLKGENK